jgi:amino acid permease
MRSGDFQDLLINCAATWIGPLLILLLSSWLLLLQVNTRARVLLWIVCVGSCAFSLWYHYASHQRTSRPYPSSF